MEKKSDTKVVNIEWADGYYTGEVSDGVRNGQASEVVGFNLNKW